MTINNPFENETDEERSWRYLKRKPYSEANTLVMDYSLIAHNDPHYQLLISTKKQKINDWVKSRPAFEFTNKQIRRKKHLVGKDKPGDDAVKLYYDDLMHKQSAEYKSWEEADPSDDDINYLKLQVEYKLKEIGWTFDEFLKESEKR